MSDDLWSIYNQQLELAFKQKNLYECHNIYQDMAALLRSENKDDSYIKQKAYEMKLIIMRGGLESFKENKLSTAEVMANQGACDECNAISGLTFSFKNEDSVLPNRKCSAEYGCRCTYLPVM